jgi:2'-5' RNA ligase
MAGSNTQRLFIGIPCSLHARPRVQAFSQTLKDNLGSAFNARWVSPETHHLTLRFLGTVKEKKVPAIIDSLTESLDGVAPFTINASGCGSFPSAQRARVLWLRIADSPALTDLQQRISGATSGIGPPDKMGFVPHVTLARFSEHANILNAIQEHFHTPLDELPVNQVHLYKSDTLPEGAVYTPLHTWTLSGDDS